MNEYISQLKEINSLQSYRLFYQSLISTVNTKISESSIESEEWLEKFQWELFPELLKISENQIKAIDDNQVIYSEVEERTQLLNICFNNMSSMELLLFIDQFLKNFELNNYEELVGIFQWLDMLQLANQALSNLRSKQFLSNAEDILSQLITTFKQVASSLYHYDPKDTILDTRTSNEPVCFHSYINQKINSKLIDLIQIANSKIDLNEIDLKSKLSKEAKIILQLLGFYSEIVSAEYGSAILDFSSIYFTKSVTSHYKLVELDSIQENFNSIYTQVLEIMEPIIPYKNIIVDYLNISEQCFDNSYTKILQTSIYFCFGLLISIELISHRLDIQSKLNTTKGWSISSQLSFANYWYLSNQLIQCEDITTKLGYIDVSVLLRLEYLFNNDRPKQFHLDENMMDFIMLINLYNNTKERKLNLIILKCSIAEYKLFDNNDQLSILKFSINNCNHLNLTQIKNGLISILKYEDQISFDLDWLNYSHLLLAPISKITLEYIHVELNYISLLISFYIYKFQKYQNLQESNSSIGTREHITLIQSDLINKLVNLIKFLEAQKLSIISMELILESIKFNLERLEEIVGSLRLSSHN
ncbi:hypothetical protein CONCODRAFT_85236 [Conidiobolus coronatus NRRL 28638]|uniref:Uncharacterized protein n=1 Tax=Conidiobolus coronatus (strain ATCC 28846 / CBS 209.66 / NRRL 28638) TaxID=796925 RepID=A0A137P6A4_CONC2|nr:hypothetical protein CONCODRAFT_85236 [Conidiobolus coronatus NRRL 28638]|eukprot:KXN70537.1 hypothetical protein CONCODRAFT_85236 [Conidiobolus coronatus NRRL 28638]